MTAVREKSLILSREELYDLVWSTPMLELAKGFRISDVALAKRCKRLGIPLPGRGHWARVEAGQKLSRPKLPAREGQWGDDKALAFAAPDVTEPNDGQSHGEALSTMRARIVALAATSAGSVVDCIDAVKRTARLHKHPSRSEFTFERGERSGPVVSIDVTDRTMDRACLLADLLLRWCAALGWSLASIPRDAGKPLPGRFGNRPIDASLNSSVPQIGELLVEGERIGLHIEERMREDVREPTGDELAREKREHGYRAVRKEYVATGNLRVVRLDSYRTYGTPNRLTWYDRGGKQVEQQLPDILAGFYELALSIKTRRDEDEREERERQAAEQRRKDLEARQEANATLIRQLETDAGAWHRAKYLRCYIRALRKALGAESVHARFGDQSVEYLAWAERYVDQLDPLRSLPRSWDFRSKTGYFGNDLEQMKAAFGRLLGSEWKDAWKLGAD